MKLYGLIGYPLSHSFSPQYFKEKFEKENINAEYRAFPISEISEIKALLKEHSQLEGFNVTVPYKERIIPYLDQIDELAKEIKSVNTVKINKRDGKISLMGFNTDVYGFHRSVAPLIKEKNIGKALVLGTGATSKTVCYALNQLQIANVKATTGKTRIENNILNYKDLTGELIQQTKLIVNTTPLGMYPETTNLPDIPYEFITADHILFDVIYNPSRTLFLEEGLKKDALIKNGFEMLVFQAEKAWEIWQDNSS
jgi:shikimate dehydrogenase